jgi:hypothetical protein
MKEFIALLCGILAIASIPFPFGMVGFFVFGAIGSYLFTH